MALSESIKRGPRKTRREAKEENVFLGFLKLKISMPENSI